MSTSLTPGRLLYLLYHQPLAEVQTSIRRGGPWEQWLDYRGRREMDAVAENLPRLEEGEGPELVLHQLTGRRYAAQSIFCLWTFARKSGRKIAPVFYDDGTLTAKQAQELRAIFRRCRIYSHEETVEKVSALLPARKFPTLRHLFSAYPHIRKIINVHLGSMGWKLVLDADLLFFREPEFLVQWLDGPTRPLHMIDVMDSYGYPREMLEELAGKSLPLRLNVGLCGLRSDSLDWPKLEWWCASLLERAGRHYLLEQALVAMLLAGETCAIASAQDYLTMPSQAEVRTPRLVMHHYVHDSKRWYFREAWRTARACAECTNNLTCGPNNL